MKEQKKSQEKQETKISQATRAELDIILEWATKEGWNPGKHDGESFFVMDKNGYLILWLNDKPIGSISLVRYSDEFAFIGLFIVAKEHRSKGYGGQLWQEAIKRLAHCKTIGLNAVPAQISRYRAAEFKDAFSNQRWEKKIDSKPEDTSTLINTSKNPHTMFKALCEYDKSAFKHDREKFLTTMLSMPQTCAFVSFNKEGTVNGYGVLRPCQTGFRIGPLYAADFESAQVLCRILLSKIPGEKVILDTPVINKFGAAFAEYFGLDHISSADTVAMFKGEKPEFKNADECYAVASLEIG